MLLKGPDDGMVSVQRTTIEGMKDFLVVPYTHTFIMARSQVIEKVISFLDAATF